MKRIVYSATADTSLAEIADQLIELGISAVPVVDETGRIVGIVSKEDLKRHPKNAIQRPLSWWSTLTLKTKEFLGDEKTQNLLKAKDVMTQAVVTISEDTPIDEIAALLEDRHIQRVPVVRDGIAIGMVGRANLLFRSKSIAER